MESLFRMASYKTSLIVNSLIISLILVGGITLAAIVAYKFRKSLMIFIPTLGFNIMLIVLISYFTLFIPVNIKITNKNIFLNGLLRKIVIPFNEIKVIQFAKYEDFNGLSRKFGVTDFWGYYGNYSSDKYSQIEMFCTNFDCVVIISTSKKSYWLSPDNSEEFVKVVKEKVQLCDPLP